MFIVDVRVGEKIEAFVSRMTISDFRKVKRRMFNFDWRKHEEQEVYKLYIDDNEILGLMCVLDHPEPGFNFLEIVLFETRKDQRGVSKRYERIAGCLLAFAARLSEKLGREGWLYLTAKTLTAEIFNKKYGFQYIGRVGSLGPRMASDEANSHSLIDRYLSETTS